MPSTPNPRPRARSSRTRDRRHPRGSSRVRPAVWIGIVALVVLAAAIAYAVYTYLGTSRSLAPSAEIRDELATVLDERPAPGTEGEQFTYVLMLGDDRRPGQSRARSDTIVLARLDSQNQSMLLLSIPRDTRVNVPGYGMTKINHAAAYGGAPLAIRTVKEFTGLPVHHYALIDFAGFGSVVDALGGVEMKVERPTRTTDGRLVEPGVHLLDGTEALAVVRNRKGHADGDFGRIRAQQAFLSAMARRAAQPANATRLPSVVQTAAGHLETDLSLRQITSLVMEYRTAAGGDMPGYTVPGSTGRIDGVSYVIPDEARANALFAAIARGETPSADLAQ